MHQMEGGGLVSKLKNKNKNRNIIFGQLFNLFYAACMRKTKKAGYGLDGLLSFCNKEREITREDSEREASLNDAALNFEEVGRGFSSKFVNIILMRKMDFFFNLNFSLILKSYLK